MMAQESAAEAVSTTVAAALAEDRAEADATSLAVVPADARARAIVRTRADGVLSGCAYAVEAFRQCDPHAAIELRLADGATVRPDDVILVVEGQARALLAAERTALNLLQQLSGVATRTAQVVAASPSELQVLDTRKTVPGLRDAQKAAVRDGGGHNQRRDLQDELLLKENHFALADGSYAETVARAVAASAGRVVGAEAETFEQARAALAAGAHYVLLDDFAPAELAHAAAELKAEFPNAVLEASGGYDVARIQELRGVAVDRVSLGALTHSAPALDLSLDLVPLPPAGESSS